MVAMTLTLAVSTLPAATSLSHTEAFSTPASTLPACTQATVASWAPENATREKNCSGTMPSFCMK
ncbi:hypothetical protein D3C86_2051970 [compost metagenome]